MAFTAKPLGCIKYLSVIMHSRCSACMQTARPVFIILFTTCTTYVICTPHTRVMQLRIVAIRCCNVNEMIFTRGTVLLMPYVDYRNIYIDALSSLLSRSLWSLHRLIYQFFFLRCRFLFSSARFCITFEEHVLL